MFIHGTLDHSHVNGPGDRAVLWLQGCTLNCHGCQNPNTHTHGDGEYRPNDKLLSWIIAADIDGLTISGGEPMQQAPDLSGFLWLVRRYRSDLSIGMFTGYTLTELEEGRFEWYDAEEDKMQRGNTRLWGDIKESLDFAVMGRYNNQQRSYAQPMCSSKNQQLVLFSDFYKETDFEVPMCEISVSPNGELISISGFPPNPVALQEAI